MGGSANQTLLRSFFPRGFTFLTRRDGDRLSCAVPSDEGIWRRFFGLSSSFPRKGWDLLHAGTRLALPSYLRAPERVKVFKPGGCWSYIYPYF